MPLCRDMLATRLQAFSEAVKENGSQRRIPNEQISCWKIPIFLLNFLFLYVYILIKNGCVEIDIPLQFTVKSSFLPRSLQCLPHVISLYNWTRIYFLFLQAKFHIRRSRILCALFSGLSSSATSESYSTATSRAENWFLGTMLGSFGSSNSRQPWGNICWATLPHHV